MADAVTTKVLFNGEKKFAIKFTNISDGTGESGVTKVAAATYGTNVSIRKIHFSTFGMSVRILWDADTDVLGWIVPADSDGCFDFSSFGGLQNEGGTGVTGNILFTTAGHTAGDTYAIVLEMDKA